MKRQRILKLATAAILTSAVMIAPAFSAGAALMGGWSATEDIEVTEEAREVLDQALTGLVGVEYEPAALLATQVVAGTNYCFLCRGTVVEPDAEPGYYFVYVYEDLEGNAEILDIQEIAFGEGVLEDTEAETEIETEG